MCSEPGFGLVTLPVDQVLAQDGDLCRCLRCADFNKLQESMS